MSAAYIFLVWSELMSTAHSCESFVVDDDVLLSVVGIICSLPLWSYVLRDFLFDGEL